MKRKTNETDIMLELNIDGNGNFDIDSGCGFLNHMMELFARHGRFDLTIKCDGDTDVDYHHSVEDIGIVLGRAFKEALGDKRGISRYGSQMLPMDEALVLCSLDISGRSFLNYDVELRAMKVYDNSAEISTARVGDFDTELVREFLEAFSREFGLTLHIKQLAGENTHHIIEAVFKALARALQKACAQDARWEGEVPSTKGSL